MSKLEGNNCPRNKSSYKEIFQIQFHIDEKEVTKDIVSYGKNVESFWMKW